MHISTFQKSSVLFVLIAVLALLVFQDGVRIMTSWDLFGYYFYLPLIFDQHQLILPDLSYPNHLNDTYHLTETFYQFVQTEKGTFYTRYSGGWAILQFPFYLIAECWATIAGKSTDGFSYPYQFMIQIGTLFYAVLGFWMTFRILLNYFSFRRSILLLVLLLFGTNMLFMLYATPAISHIFSFSLLAVLIHRLIHFSQKQTIFRAVVLGVIWGLLTLVRPPDAIFGILFLVWDSNRKGGIVGSIRWWLKDHWKLTIMLFVGFFITCFPQFYYWKVNAGSWIIDSYGPTPNEGFDWSHPHVIDFLFSFRKGWFVYTPVMIIAFYGFFKGLRKDLNVKWMLFSSLLFLYVISAWSCWWYAASFGSRAAVDMYALLVLGLGFALEDIKSLGIKIGVGVILGLCILLNIFQTWQTTVGIIHVERMTRAYYLSVFAQTTVPTEAQKELLLIDRGRLMVSGLDDEKGLKRIAFFSKALSQNPITPELMYGPHVKLSVRNLINDQYTWLKVTYQLKDTTGLNGTIFMVNSEHDGDAYYWSGYEFGSSTVDYSKEKQTLSFTYLLPDFRYDGDSLSIGVWKRYGNPLVLKHRKLEFLAPETK